MEDRPLFPREDLAALVGSRLCHDLVNPLGAIGNGVELLGMTGLPDSPELALIQEAVKEAQARIRFFRIAFGAASEDQEISDRESREILQALYDESRLRVAWINEGSKPRDQVKRAFLALNCAEAALPLGGSVTLIASGDGGVRLEAEAERITHDLALWQILEHPSEAGDVVRPATVQFLLLRDAVAGAGRSARVSVSETSLTLEV